jgi:hypothetical protein
MAYAERNAALLMLAEKVQDRHAVLPWAPTRLTTARISCARVREPIVTPQATKNDKNRSCNLNRGTTRQPGYAISHSRRWLIEKGFGWRRRPARSAKLCGGRRWIGYSSSAVNPYHRGEFQQVPKCVSNHSPIPAIRLGGRNLYSLG